MRMYASAAEHTMDEHRRWMAQAMDGTLQYNPGDKMPSRNQTEAKVTIRSRGDTLINIRPEGPPDQGKVGLVEALGKAWSWRMPLQK